MVRLALRGLMAFALVLIPAWSSLHAQTRIMCIGDSITYGVNSEADRPPVGSANDGYLPWLADWLDENWGPVVLLNKGVPGDSTFEGRSRIQNALATTAPDVVLVMFGTNDVGDIWNAGTGNAGINSAISNLGVILTRIQEYGALAIVATVLPRRNSGVDPNNDMTRTFNNEVRGLAGRRGLVVADQENNFEDHWFAQVYSDALHPSEVGYQIMAEEWAAAIAGTTRDSIDMVAPFTTSVTPRPYTTSAPPAGRIEIDLMEFGAGIDANSLGMMVDGQSVLPQVSGSSTLQTVVHQPTTPWSFGQHVTVAFTVSDLNVPPNSLELNYTFKVSAGNGTGGDVDSSGRVDGADLIILGVAFASTRGQSRYEWAADVDLDGVVDGNDLAFVASQFGQLR